MLCPALLLFVLLLVLLRSALFLLLLLFLPALLVLLLLRALERFNFLFKFFSRLDFIIQFCPKKNLKTHCLFFNVSQKMTTSHWILALQIHHAIKKHDNEDDSILSELRVVHTNALPVCGIIPQQESQSWVIPARGTPEYNEVSSIRDILRENQEIEEMAREFLRIQAKNKEWREHLNSP